jgi:ubiquitin-protein ligase
MRGGRQVGRGNAALRSTIVGGQTNTVRRLHKDLKELREAKVPLYGVTAAPLDNSIYTWHGNLKGPDSSAFKGGVFHFEMNFPTDYPVSPPTITLFTDIPHPNVFGKTLCLDML